MDVGVIIGDVAGTTDPRTHLDELLLQVEGAQRAGVRYITIGQHFLYGEYRWLQPVPTLARLAAEVSSDTRLATTVMLAPLYHPVVLAEELATLDIVTAGRLIVGLGLGYRTKEFQNLAIEYKERVARFEEAVELMNRLWTELHVVHHGRFFDVDGEPHIRPWQQPRPPIWIGADAVPGVMRAARLADAWLISPSMSVDRAAELVAAFAEERTRLELPMGPQPIRRDVAFGADPESALRYFAELSAPRYKSYAANERGGFPQEELASRLVHGTVKECVEGVELLAKQLPIDPLIVRPHWPGMSTSDLERYLDQLAEFVAGVATITSS